MVTNALAGYFWMTLGFLLLIFFGGKLFLQLLGIFLGLGLIMKGLRILAIDRTVYNYSAHYFYDNFKK